MSAELIIDEGFFGKVSQAELGRQVSMFAQSDLVQQLLDVLPSYYLILNSRRQIVYFNAAFQEFLKIEEPKSIYGTRPGEILKCLNAVVGHDGCGSSKFCKTCGALHAILSSLKGNKDIQECKINLKDSGESYEFRVHSKPLHYQGETFSLFSLTDIRGEKRKRALERVFYHDIMNSAGALQGILSVLESQQEEKGGKFAELGKMAVAVAHRMVDDIRGQRDITLAENNELRVQPSFIQPRKIVDEIATAYRYHHVGKKKNILVWHPEDADFPMVTDASLLRRILGNLLKNALEASQQGDTVSISWKVEKMSIQFYVHNAQPLSEDVERNIFHRSFSTKGDGRGLGTYSVKLFAERYLDGDVRVESDRLSGTTVYLDLPFALKKSI